MHRTYVRRRRLLALATAALLGLPVSAAIARGASVPGPTDPAASQAVSRSYVVRTGDTLWSIASVVAPSHDPRRVIADLEQLNGPLGSLTPGQVLAIPSSG